jgi:hypothetical protein
MIDMNKITRTPEEGERLVCPFQCGPVRIHKNQVHKRNDDRYYTYCTSAHEDVLLSIHLLFTSYSPLMFKTGVFYVICVTTG